MDEKKITGIVKELQKDMQNDMLWQELFQEMAEEKEFTIQRYCPALKFMTREDVIALYEDTLLDTISKFNPITSDNFIPYFKVSMKNAKHRSIVEYHTSKKVLDWKYVTSSEVLTDSDGTELIDLQEDESTVVAVENMEARYDLELLLEQYSQSGKKQRHQYALLLSVFLQNPGCDTSDNKEKLLAVMPEGTSWVACRKALQRAREGFKKFFEENK